MYGSIAVKNDSVIKPITFQMWGAAASFAKLTVSAAGTTTTPSNLQDDGVATYYAVKPDSNGSYWIKYELTYPEAVNMISIFTQKSYPSLNIKALTLAEAKKTYYCDYWLKGKFEEISDDLVAMQLFDLSVNLGIRIATIVLQRALRSFDKFRWFNGH